jgi:hypothetical protein
MNDDHTASIPEQEPIGRADLGETQVHLGDGDPPLPPWLRPIGPSRADASP